MITESMTNPWDIQSIYDLQYFVCPACIFYDPSRQELVNHACKIHPESVEFLKNIKENIDFTSKFILFTQNSSLCQF